MITLEITDNKTGQVHIVCQSNHDAKKLYMALREVFGDAQTNAKPGELLTFPNATVKV